MKHTQRVIVNLTQVKYIDSAGVASLIEGLKASRDAKTTFALYGLSKVAREVLELTRLLKVFESIRRRVAGVAGQGIDSPGTSDWAALKVLNG